MASRRGTPSIERATERVSDSGSPERSRAGGDGAGAGGVRPAAGPTAPPARGSRASLLTDAEGRVLAAHPDAVSLLELPGSGLRRRSLVALIRRGDQAAFRHALHSLRAAGADALGGREWPVRGRRGHECRAALALTAVHGGRETAPLALEWAVTEAFAGSVPHGSVPAARAANPVAENGRGGPASGAPEETLEEALLERERRRRTLAEANEQRYRRILDGAYEGLWVVDAEGRTEYVNERLAEMLGYTVDEMLGRPVFDFMDDEARKEARERFGRRRQGVREQFDFRYRRKDGSALWASVASTPIRDSEGNFAGSLGMLTDLSGRRREERARRRREDQLRRITDALPALVGYLGPDQHYRFNNEGYERWFGLPASEITGRHVRDVLGEAAYQVVRPHIERALAGREVTFEARVPYRDGPARPVRATYVPDVGPDGAVRGIAMLTSDVTDHHAAQEALRESEARFRGVVETNVIGVFFWDVGGRLLDGNDAFCRLLGYSREELRGGGLCWRELTPAEYAGLDDRMLQEVLERGACAPFEKEYFRRDGGRVPVRIVCAMLPGFADRGVGFVTDITEQKRSERRLAAQYRVARVLAAAPGIVEAAREVLRAVCETLGWSFGAWWGVDVEGDAGTLRCAQVWHAPSAALDEFAAASRAARLARGEGLPARALESGAPLWIPDVWPEADFPRRSAAREAGLRTAICCPLRFGGQSVGMLEFLDPEVRPPDAELLEVLEGIGSQLGQFLERARAEEALRRSEERYRTIVQVANDGVWLVDREGVTVYANDRMAAMLGYTAGELVGRPVSDFCFPEDRGAARERIASNLAGRHEQFDFRFRRRDGSALFVLASTNAVRDGQGGIFGALGMFTDVTERRHAEEGLRFLSEASVALASSLDFEFTLATVARLAVPRLADWCTVHLLEPDGSMRRIVAMHADPEKVELARRLGEEYPTRAGAPAGPGRVVVTGRSEMAAEITDETLRQAAQDERHLEILRSLGVRSYIAVPLVARERVLGAIALVTAESGRRYGPEDLAIVEDLAHRAAAAVDNALLYRSVRENEERYRLAARATNDVIWDWDLRTGRAGWNEALGTLFGYEGTRETTAEWWKECIHPEDRERVVRGIHAVIEGRDKHWADEYRFLRRDGTYADVYDRGYMVRDEDGRPLRMIGAMQDISERRRAEQERAKLLAAEADARAEAEEAQRRAAFLAEASTVLSSSLDYEATVGRVARMCVTSIAEGCTVDVLDGRGGVRRTAIVHAVASKEELLREMLRRYPVDLAGQHPIARVLRTGEMQAKANLSEADLRRFATDEEHLGLLRRIGATAFMVLPLKSRGRTFGTLSLWQTSDRSFRASDIGLAQDLARRIAATIDNTHLYRDVREIARSERERASQLRSLAEVALRINSAMPLQELLRTLTEEARAIIGAHQAVTSLTMGQDWSQSISSISLSDKYAAWRSYDERPTGAGIYSLVCRENRPIRLTQEELEAHPGWRAFGAAADRHPPMRGWLAAPLAARDGRNLGLIQLSDKYEGDFTANDEAILVQLAQMASAAIENADYAATLERRVAERTAALQESYEQLEAFSYSVSHDLRAPLRAIQGFLDVLVQDFGERLDETGHGYVERVITATRQMDSLIRDLLDYSRLSRAELSREQLHLPTILAELRARLEPTLAERGATLAVELAEDLPRVSGHAATLLQSLSNLVSNAVKFVAPGVAPRVVARAERRPGGWVRLWVEDNGIGIAPEYHERIFRVFERLHGGERYPGTGVGLAIVRKGVERMGGRVGLESAPGRGSRFWLELRAV